jgi:diguanylate cyclase (GGDEF)-like protein
VLDQLRVFRPSGADQDRRGAVTRPDAEKALERAGSRATTLLLVDLDDFAKINERHGTGAGDRVLRIVASILRNTLRAKDVAGRHDGPGGGGFLVLLPARDRQLGELIARRIRARIRRAIIPARSANGVPVRISNLTVSIGAAVSDPTTVRTRNLAELLRQADAALHQARSRGGDQIVVAGGVAGILSRAP